MRRLALTLALFCATSAQAEHGELNDEELRFIAANAEFTLLHEMGHLLIHELQLPVLGREEDAADQLGFMGLFLLYQRQRDAGFYAKLVDVADYWRLEWQRPKKPGEEVPAWDSHALDEQRFYNMACLAYGSAPRQMDWVIEATGLPEERAFYCVDEYQQAHHAVTWLMERFRRPADGPPLHRIQVIYDAPSDSIEDGAQIQREIRASGELEAVAAKASHDFPLPRDLVLRMTSCAAPDAWYNRISGELTLCYERLVYFRELARQLPALRQGRPQATR